MGKRNRIEVTNSNGNGTSRKTAPKKPRDLLNRIEPKTEGQRRLLRAIDENDIVVCDGPAGTGKTLLTTFCALEYYLQSPGNRRIIIVRPVIPAGDDDPIGFIPGTVIEKLRPFLAPIMCDAAPLLLNSEIFRTNLNHYDRGAPDPMAALIAKFDIEIVPLQHMRGRTFNNSFIILDEAQNCTKNDLKLFITRLGQGSKVVIEGDSSQADREDSYLEEFMTRMDGAPDTEIVRLSTQDIVRNPLIAELLRRLD